MSGSGCRLCIYYLLEIDRREQNHSETSSRQVLTRSKTAMALRDRRSQERRFRSSKEDKMLSRHNELSSLLGSYLHHSLLHSLIQLETNENNEHANKWILRRNESESTTTCGTWYVHLQWQHQPMEAKQMGKKTENLFVSTPTMKMSAKKIMEKKIN